MNAETTARRAVKDQAAIDRAAALCKDVSGIAMKARELSTEKPVQETAWGAVTAAMQALNLLVSAGAALPFDAPKPDPLDLSRLAQIADPDAPELLALLEQAQAVAERIDLRRGHVVEASVPLQPGESRGTDLAESISTIALRVRTEAFGPVCRE